MLPEVRVKLDQKTIKLFYGASLKQLFPDIVFWRLIPHWENMLIISEY